jgi:hypothetical protein
MPDGYLILFAFIIALTNVAILRVVRGPPVPGAVWTASFRLVTAGLLIGVLGDRLGYPWWAYYSVPLLLLSTLAPAARFGLTAGRAAAYAGLRVLTIPIVYGMTALLIRTLMLPWATALPVHRDFEKGGLWAWSHEFAAPHAVQLVPDPVDPDNQVARFERRPGDRPVNLGRRAELSEFAFKAPFGREVVYRFRTYIPSDWPNQDVRCLIAQWHAWHDWVLAEALRSPVLGIEYRDDAFLIRLCHNEAWRQQDNSPASNHKTVLYRSDAYAEKGIWHTFEVRVRWSPDPDGAVRVWIDGHPVVDYVGPIGYRDALGPYFKMGLYRDETPDTFVIYHDDYRRYVTSPPGPHSTQKAHGEGE